jgi:SsrA-binding protein
MSKRLLTENRAISHAYTILERLEAGIKLAGPEVKSIKQGNVTLKGSYVSVRFNKENKAEAWLIGAGIGPYAKAGYAQKADYQRERPKKLLLKKKEIGLLIGKQHQKGLTIVPLSLYTSDGLIKIDIAIVKGTDTVDKRERLKKREFLRRRQKLLYR